MTSQSLKVRRKKLGYIQQVIANMLGVSQGTISRIENGRTILYRNRYAKLLDKLELERAVELRELLDDKHVDNPPDVA
jgi:transcriptional regulator with XRE-family HTH domain